MSSNNPISAAAARLAWAAGLAWLAVSPVGAAGQSVPVLALAAAPAIDGVADDWAGAWQTVHVHPALESDDKNATGELDVQIQAGVFGDEIYVVARWPDSEADVEYREWVWRGKKYKRGRNRDDMFAVRFDMGGDFKSCMIAEADYDVDVWLWSAGRSNQKDYATDMWHKISISMLENAAEYESEGGKTVYIKKGSDDGTPGFANTKGGKKKTTKRKPGIKLVDGPSGSLADVAAKGVWQDGTWTLEFKRKLETGNADDVVLPKGKTIRGQVAVFNKGFAEHKSVSDELVFDLSGL